MPVTSSPRNYSREASFQESRKLQAAANRRLSAAFLAAKAAKPVAKDSKPAAKSRTVYVYSVFRLNRKGWTESACAVFSSLREANKWIAMQEPMVNGVPRYRVARVRLNPKR